MRHSYALSLLLSTLAGGSLLMAGCGDDGFECGPNTTEVDGTCVPDTTMICAEGTMYDSSSGRCEREEGSGTTCGEGTIRNEDGECVPEDELIECGTGTSLMAGNCVPDGSVVCGGNTVFDMAEGACIPDPEAICEGDTVYVMSTDSCVERDTTLLDMAEVLESDEPNDPDINEEATLPELMIPESDPLTFGGCIEPTVGDDGLTERDTDVFVFNADGPTLLELITDGIGGLSVGLRIEPGPDQPELDDEAGGGANVWFRQVFDLAGDGTTGQVFLPKSGAYYIRVSDSRTFILPGGPPAGGEGNCYFNQVRRVDIPTPTTLTAGEVMTGTYGDPQFYTVDAADTYILTSVTEIDAEGEPADVGNQAGAVVVTVGDRFDGQAAIGSWDGLATAVAPVANVGSETPWIVVDQIFSLIPDEVQFTIEAIDKTPPVVPEDGDVMFTVPDNFDGGDPRTWNYAQFTGSAGDVAHISFDGGGVDTYRVLVVQPNLIFTTACDGCLDWDGHISLENDGIHLLFIINQAADAGDSFTATFTRQVITPTAETRGMATAIDLDTLEPSFLSADLSMSEWISMDAANLTDITEVGVLAYPAGQFGILGTSIPSVHTSIVDGTTGSERILRGLDAETWLFRVFNNTDAGGSFDFTIDEQSFTELEVGSTGVTGETLPAGSDFARFIINGEIFSDLEFTATTMAGAVDLAIEILDDTAAPLMSIDDEGPGADEVYMTRVAAPGWYAVGVRDTTETGGMFDFVLNSTPGPYSLEVQEDVELVSVCSSQGGMGEDLFAGDDVLGPVVDLTMPTAFGFDLFDTTVTEMTISSNGWITFEASFAGDSGLAPATGLVIAPLERDLVMDEVCTYRDGDTYTIEMRGAVYSFFGDGEPVEMQVRLSSATGTIEFIYGAGHLAALGNLIGLRNVDPMDELAYTEPVMPNSALVWTPTP